MSSSPNFIRNELLIAELMNDPIYGERFHKYAETALRLSSLN